MENTPNTIEHKLNLNIYHSLFLYSNSNFKISRILSRILFSIHSLQKLHSHVFNIIYKLMTSQFVLPVQTFSLSFRCINLGFLSHLKFNTSKTKSLTSPLHNPLLPVFWILNKWQWLFSKLPQQKTWELQIPPFHSPVTFNPWVTSTSKIILNILLSISDATTVVVSHHYLP